MNPSADPFRRECQTLHKRFLWSLAETGYGLFCLFAPRYFGTSEGGLGLLVLLNHEGAAVLTAVGVFASVGYFVERRKAPRERLAADVAALRAEPGASRPR
jgi:hypothetical protein